MDNVHTKSKTPEVRYLQSLDFGCVVTLCLKALQLFSSSISQNHRDTETQNHRMAEAGKDL